MNVEDGVIGDLAFYGDYFSSREPDALAHSLRGCRLERGELRRMLDRAAVGDFFWGAEPNDLVELLVG